MRPPPSDASAPKETVADAERQQAGRLAMYEELTAALAHEINNPVYAARLALELLGQDLDSTGAESVYLAIATDGLRRVSAIIERLRLAIQNETQPAPDASLDGLIAEAQRGHTLAT
jgi:two-component system NtrC family sensor kinase